MPLRRRTVLRITIFTAVFTAVAPLVLAVFLARQQGLSQEFERVTGLVSEIIYRSDRAVAQMQEGLDQLELLQNEPPCSAGMVQRIQELGVSMQYLDALGYIDDQGRLLCSSIGIHEPPLELGPASLTSSLGNDVRMDISLLAVPDLTFNVLSRNNFAVMASSEQAIDLGLDMAGLVVATFVPASGRTRIVRGELNPSWISRLGEDQQSVRFIDGSHIVAVMRSSAIQLTGALVAIPVSSLNQRILDFTLLMLPVGLLTGLVLTLLVLYLARQRLSQASEIRAALKHDEFFLVYQPVADMQTGEWTGAEALVRWRQRDGNIVMPDTFIPAAEQSGQITDITLKVIELARREMSELLRLSPDFQLNINLSANDLLSVEVSDALDELVAASGNRPEQITVELTERILVDPDLASSGIQAIRDKGIRFAIDDFGTGYSSLSYLEKMDFDSLKIDKLFVEAIDTEAATNKVVLHIIEMARTLGISMVAEGVETEAQASFLRKNGVRYAQGWLFARPMETDRFKAGLSLPAARAASIQI